MPSSVEQYQKLTAIWPAYRKIAASTRRKSTSSINANDDKAVQAVIRLYRFYGQSIPAMTWYDSPRHLPLIPSPLTCHFRDTLIYGAWPRLADPAWVCTRVGYDQRQDAFRLPLNKMAVFGQTRFSNRRRPPWSRQAANIVSQFDVDILAIYQLAASLGGVDPMQQELAETVTGIATSCFAVVLFEDACQLIRKPTKLLLNERQQVSAERETAIEFDDWHLHMIHGEFLAKIPPMTNLETLAWEAPRRRALLIDYLGWENFYGMLRQASSGMLTNHRMSFQRLDGDRYGTLYVVAFSNQRILMVRVKNSTAEPDGSYRHYVIPVDPHCRPLPNPDKPEDQLGQVQPLTALNAVASTFGMTGVAYAEMLGAES